MSPRQETGPQTAEGAIAAIVERYSEADVPTEYGVFRIVVYREIANPDVEHCAIVRGDVAGARDLLIRVHSECFTGEVLHSLKCDCRDQLDQALRFIAEEDKGAVIDTCVRKAAASGWATRSVRTRCSSRAPTRSMPTYAWALRPTRASTMWRLPCSRTGCGVGFRAHQQPGQVDALRADGVAVTGRVPMDVIPNQHNREYLDTKRERMGHLIRVRELAERLTSS